MADNKNNKPAQTETDNQLTKLDDLKGIVFGSDAKISFKTSLAFNGKARSDKDFQPVTLNISLAGIKLQEFAEKAAAQGAIAFQRTRRDKNSGGVFETREQYDQYVEELGDTVSIHYNDLGKAPEKIKTPEETVNDIDALLASLPAEKREAWLKARMS